MIGTFHLPSLNPINESSIFALIILSLVILSTRRFMPRDVRLVVAGLGPPVLLLLSELFPLGRFPDAGDYTANYILLAGAFGIALHNFRYTRLAHRINGAIFTYVTGSLICLHAVLRLKILFPVISPLPVVIAFLVCWTPVVVRLNRLTIRQRRINRGLCRHCGYNLTGNVSGICPECGGMV